MVHVIMFSGGIGSYCAARRVVAIHGSENVIGLFADTKAEDEDLYRFLRDAEAFLKLRIITVADGRSLWEVFRDDRFIGNSRVDKCSQALKRRVCKRWVRELEQSSQVSIYVGIDFTEAHRLKKIRRAWAPTPVYAPMCERPLLQKLQMIEQCKNDGIRPPRLYELGFPHNNCGGFCVKAGQAQFAKLLALMPERYMEHERMEEELRQFLGKNVAVLRSRKGGRSKPLTMRAFREMIEAQGTFERDDWGGCGCFA